MAAHYVEGGVDIIKDDQGLVDQPWCPFEERVVRCAEAIGQAGSRRGRPWGRIKLTMPAVGGRVGLERIPTLGLALGRDVVFVLGSRIQLHSSGMVAAIGDCLLALTAESKHRSSRTS